MNIFYSADANPINNAAIDAASDSNAIHCVGNPEIIALSSVG